MGAGGKPATQLAAAVRRCGVISAAAIGLCPYLEVLVAEAWLYARRRLEPAPSPGPGPSP